MFVPYIELGRFIMEQVDSVISHCNCRLEEVLLRGFEKKCTQLQLKKRSLNKVQLIKLVMCALIARNN